MQERVYKVEINDELIDMLEIRIQDKTEIEIFVLTQALGLFELLERKVILTSQCKKSVMCGSTEKALLEIHAAREVVEVISKAAKLQGTVLEVTDDVVEQAKLLKEETILLLEERLKEEQEKKREWVEMFDFDVKTLRKMHDEAMAKRQKELEEKIKQKERWGM